MLTDVMSYGFKNFVLKNFSLRFVQPLSVVSIKVASFQVNYSAVSVAVFFLPN